MSDYKIISALNEEHKVYLVQSALSGNIYVQKILDVYNLRVYEYLYRNPVAGIPRLINYYEDGNQLIVIEEYISGTSLQEKIDNSDLSVSDIRSYMIMLCNILEALHSMTPPIIHRDIKPSNIIITSYNYAMLLDFNAAKQFSGQNESDTVLIGTPGYAAPEQYGFGSSSPKTDIYSLGIVLREMLGSITPVPDIAPILHQLNLIAERCTQMTPAARYQSVTELKKMLLSSVAYLFIIWLCLSLELENTYGAKLWLERIFCLGMFIFAIFCGFNYLNVQNILPLCKSKNRFLHYVGIILLDVAVIFALFVIMFIIESVAFPIN